MPTYRITRLWSVAGYTTSEVEADSEDAARAIEEARWEEAGVVPSLPPELRLRIEDLFVDVETVEDITP